ncbi:MAG: TIM barrel protein, partial [Clostridia bacterium]
MRCVILYAGKKSGRVPKESRRKYMLKLGVCTVVENIEAVAAAGFDYLETSLAGIAAMENPAFEEAYHQVMDAPIGVEVCNCMIPPTLALTGPNVCVDQIETYLAHAFGRAARLGGRLIVFGSGAARQVPDGFPMEAAMRQIEAFLHLCIPHCESTGIRIAIEPLRKAETNVLNTLREGMALAQRVDHPA